MESRRGTRPARAALAGAADVAAAVVDAEGETAARSGDRNLECGNLSPLSIFIVLSSFPALLVGTGEIEALRPCDVHLIPSPVSLRMNVQ